MSEAEPERLADVDPTLADYASALRRVESPAPPQVAAVWSEVEARARPRRRLWIPLAIATAALVVGVVALAPSSVFERDQSSRGQEAPYQGKAPKAKVIPEVAPQAPPQVRNPAAPRAPEPTPEAPRPPSEAREAIDPAPERPTRPRVESRPAPTPEPGPSSLARETKLLREIQTAQAADKHARVLELTREHAQQFPKGTFAAERSLARARALCGLGRVAEAHALTERFVERHPKSHLVAQFETVCSK